MKHVTAVDPELTALAQAPGLELSAQTLPAARDYMLAMLAVPAQALSSATVTVEERHIGGEGTEPAVRVIIYRPVGAAATRPAILEIHGGGFVLGVAEQNDGQNRQLAETLGCVVVAVNYRLAPEARGMAAVDDCYAVLRWLYREAAALGIDPGRIAVMGDSAGGGIAAGLVLLARDRGEVPIRCQVLTYPMLDDRTGASVDPGRYSGEYAWSRAANRFGWDARLGHEAGSRVLSPYLSVAHADELAGLPPTFIGVGALDLFAAENIAYAQQLIRWGVATELHVYPGAMHGFDWLKETRVAQQFASDRLAALRRLLA